MPSHPDRVSKHYDGLCVKCLKNPDREWMCVDTIINNWNLCESCNDDSIRLDEIKANAPNQ